MVNMMMMMKLMNKSQFIVNNQRWARRAIDYSRVREGYPEGVFMFHDADCRLAL